MLPSSGFGRRRFFPAARAAATLLLAIAAPGARAFPAEGPTADRPPRRPIARSREITPELRLAIDRGLRWLVRNQSSSGSFAGADNFPVAVDGLAGLAFLAGGYTDEEGPFTETLRRGITHLLSKQDDSGYFNDRQSKMYGHGFATLFLAELYGMTGDRAQTVRTALKKAVKLIEASQCQDGGWDYEPVGMGMSDTSIAACQAMALRAARNLGIEVNRNVVERARDFISKAQNRDGGFCYRIYGTRRLNGFSEFPRSAAGVCILYGLATKADDSSDSLRRGLDYLQGHYRSFNQFPYYGYYYCTQAMFLAGGKYWEEYWPYLRETLLKSQRADGSWSPIWPVEATPQTTAMALIALQVPFHSLPILER